MRKIRFFALYITLILLVISCGNFMLPNRVQVKAKPTFKASAGELTFKLSDYISAQKLNTDKMKESGFEFYEYQPEGDDTMHLLFKASKTIPIKGLDIEKYLNALDNGEPRRFGYEADGKTPKVLFTIPKIEKNEILKEINVKEMLGIKKKLVFSELSFDVLEGATIDFTSPDTAISWAVHLDAVVFDNNSYLELPFKPMSAASDDFRCTITKIELLTKTNKVLLTDTKPLELSKTEVRTKKLNLSGRTMPKDVKVRVSCSLAGGVALKTNKISFTPKWSDGATIKKVIGLNSTITINDIPDQTIQLDSDVLQYATIKTGFISLNAAFPSADDGTITSSFTLNVRQDSTGSTPGLTISQNLVGNPGFNLTGNGKIDLKDKTITAKDIRIEANGKITFTNATIDFSKSSPIFKPKFAVKIEEFSSLTLDTSGKIPAELLSKRIEIPLADVKKWVNWINFTKILLKVDVHNGIPMDITPHITSTQLDIDNSPLISAANPVVVSTPIEVKSTTLPKKINFTSLDNFVITLDASDLQGVKTFTNVKTGTDYTFCGEASFEVDWDTAEFRLPDDAMTKFEKRFDAPESVQNYKENYLKKYLGDKADKFSIKAPKIYVYTSAPVIKQVINKNNNNLEFEGPVKVVYNGDEDFLIKGSTSIKFSQAPNFKHNGDYIIKQALPQPSVIVDDAVITDMLKQPKLSDLQLVITAGLKKNAGADTVMEIEKKNLANIKNFNIDISVVADIPLALNITGDKLLGSKNYLELDVKEIAKKAGQTWLKGDLFKGNKPNIKDADIEKYIKTNECGVSLILRYNNRLGLHPRLKIQTDKLKDKEGNKVDFEKWINLDEGEASTTLTLNAEEALAVLRANEFSPDIKLYIPAPEQSIKRDASLTLGLAGEIKLSVDYTQNFGGK